MGSTSVYSCSSLLISLGAMLLLLRGGEGLSGSQGRALGSWTTWRPCFSLAPSQHQRLSRGSRISSRSPQRQYAQGKGGALGPKTLNWEVKKGDVFISALSKNGQVGCKVVSASQMLQSVKDKRELSDVATELLGRVMLSAMLVAHGVKDQETLQLTFNGDGLAKGVMAISDGACNVRGWIGNNELDELKAPPGQDYPDIKRAVGSGTLQVVKYHPSWAVPYNGVVEIVSGEVAPDVAFYLASSEQRNTAIGVGVVINQGTVQSAAGFYIEMLPGVEEESITQVEENLARLRERQKSLDPGRLMLPHGQGQEEALSPYALVELLLKGLGVGVAEESSPKYTCTCSREKLANALRLLGEDEIEDILDKEGQVLAKCEFCGESYSFSSAEVREARQQKT